MIKIYDCKVEYKENPVCIGTSVPLFSWKIESDKQGVYQVSRRIVVMTGRSLLWDSGAVNDNESRFIKYEGLPLASRMECGWHVEITVLDKDGNREKAVSENNCFRMGLLNAEDWKCRWIEPEDNPDRDEFNSCPYLRKKFNIAKAVNRATIYQTAHGLYESYINGFAVTDDKFNPGLTSYYQRVQYQAYDVTEKLNQGENVWAVILGDGWWRGSTLRNNFGYKLAFFGQLEIEYSDGTYETIVTDDSFVHSNGGLVSSDMKAGDVFNACLEPKSWKKIGFDDSDWERVHYTDFHTDAALISSDSVPVREKECFEPKVFRDAKGNLCLDFGQNIAGYVKMKVRGCKSGDVIRLTHGEMLKDGEFYIGNIHPEPIERHDFQCVTYICSGEREEYYCPMFSVFGFRYVMVEGYEGEILPGDFTAVAVYSDLEITGKFACSSDKITQLFQNTMWSQKGNFLDVATDCPTRERNAWTGDSQVYVRTACNLMNVYPFFEKWLKDQTIEQYESGKVGITFPSTSSLHNPEELQYLKKQNPFAELAGPTGNGNIGEDCAGWGDAAVWNPYIVYLCSGNRRIIENQYLTARKWVDYMLKCAKDKNPLYADEPQYHRSTFGEPDGNYIYDTRMHYGEWQEPIESKNKGETLDDAFARLIKEGKPLVATAYMCRSARNISEMADILGNATDKEKYSEIADRIGFIYDRYFIGDDGLIEEGHQAAYVRALAFNLCSEKKRNAVINQLIKEIENNGYRLNTGFLSTPFLLQVLCDAGYNDIAYRILEQEEYPSWLYSVNLGATTIPESWHAFSSGKDSLNHYSYGAVTEFLFAYVAGIRPIFTDAGYKSFVLKPIPGGSLDWADCEYESPFGKIKSGWNIENGYFNYCCTVPANATATLILPDNSEKVLGSGKYEFRVKL